MPTPEFPCVHAFRCDDMYHRTPPRQCVTIDRREEALGEHFKQVVRPHVWSVQGLAHAVEVGCAGAGDDEVLGEDGCADEIHACRKERVERVEKVERAERVERVCCDGCQ